MVDIATSNFLQRFINISTPRHQQPAPSSVSSNLYCHGNLLRRVLCLPTRDDIYGEIGGFQLLRVLCLSTGFNKLLKQETDLSKIRLVLWQVIEDNYVYLQVRGIVLQSTVRRLQMVWQRGCRRRKDVNDLRRLQRKLQLDRLTIVTSHFRGNICYKTSHIIFCTVEISTHNLKSVSRFFI